ncbi:hypothetical protein ACFX1X_013654 [Malus domestica]
MDVIFRTTTMSSNLNPNVSMFVPLAYQTVEDFSVEWGALSSADGKQKKAGGRQCCICHERRATFKRPKTLEQICRECFYKVFEDEIHQVIVENQLFKPGPRSWRCTVEAAQALQLGTMTARIGGCN